MKFGVLTFGWWGDVGVMEKEWLKMDAEDCSACVCVTRMRSELYVMSVRLLLLLLLLVSSAVWCASSMSSGTVTGSCLTGVAGPEEASVSVMGRISPAFAIRCEGDAVDRDAEGGGEDGDGEDRKDAEEVGPIGDPKDDWDIPIGAW